MNRQILLVASTTLLLTGFLCSQMQKDTLTRAANRFGRAVLESDIETLWTFVPQDERAYYDLDQKKFAQYWRTIVQPHLAKLDSFEVEAAGTNGFDVIAKGTDGTKERSFSLLVSGQRGHYYVPYIIGTAGIHAAASDISGQNVTKYQRFDHYAKWAEESKDAMKAIGIRKVRRGPMFQGETLDQMGNHFKEIADKDFDEVQLAQL